ncbi:hypothetical protein BJV74DRAFT_949129 [Russula compacta]|nr:hypothetical protein BJV74DRAFT_949129 [Russula compacta]
MGTPYIWPYYHPQQHPYFQFPPQQPTLALDIDTQAAPPVAAPVYQPTLLHPGYSRSRRHSFDTAYVPVQPVVAAPATTPWPTVPAPYFTYSPSYAYTAMELPRPQLHNLINGEIIAQHLYIDFAEAEVVFRKRTGSGFHGLTTLGGYDLEQPATNPQMTRVRVVCDPIPQWPVDLQVIGTTLSPHRRRRGALPYLTLEDVLSAVHASLHRKISHEEWGRLTVSQETEVARAYTRRFKSSGSEWASRQQQAEGVKRVDFLLKNTWFKGFTWLEPENGVERLKLLLGKES